MVGTTDLQNVRFSNDSGIQMSGFRIPTVFTLAYQIQIRDQICHDQEEKKESVKKNNDE